MPFLFLLSQALDLELDLLAGVFHLAHVELVEVDYFPFGPVVVPLLFDFPNVEQRVVLFLDFGQLFVVFSAHLENFQADLHLLLFNTQVLAVNFELFDLLEGFLIVEVFEVFGELLGSLKVEFFTVFLDFALELFHFFLHVLFEHLLCFVDDILGLSHSCQEIFPLLV